MTDKKPEIDAIMLAQMYTGLLHRVDDKLEERLAASSANVKNFLEGVRTFFSIVAFRHMTTPIAITGMVRFYWFPENKRFGMRSEVRELRVFGVRLARWPVTQTLAVYELPRNPLQAEEPEEEISDAEKETESK